MNGVTVFLDERDIKIGESIPGRVHELIEKARYLICIVSSHSVESAWVKEELDAAKMRQLESQSCTVLPLRIDTTPVPAPLRHVKWADFRHADDPREYTKAIRDLLAAMGISQRIPQSDELRLFLKYWPQFGSAHNAALEMASILEGARIADWIASDLANAKRGQGLRTATKWYVEEGSVLDQLASFRKLLSKTPSRKRSDAVNELRVALKNLHSYWSKQTRDDTMDYAKSQTLANLAHRVAAIINEIRATASSLLTESFDLRPSNPVLHPTPPASLARRSRRG